jgi:hypothetical protein
MRPVNRGPTPPQAFSDYRNAFGELGNRLGRYCSFCERRLETHLAVEHMQPKSLHPALKLCWENFLLACCNCNSCKGDHDIDLADYLWPDKDNTLLVFTYPQGMVKNALPQNHPAHKKADALILLLGLDKDPGNPDRKRRPTNSDERWKRRTENFDLANRQKQNLAKHDNEGLREAIVEIALGWGGFAIWFEVFQDDEDMKARLIAAFPGTAPDCFDNHSPVPRPGGFI